MKTPAARADKHARCDKGGALPSSIRVKLGFCRARESALSKVVDQ